ncbi:coiled-coil domain-containing protein 186 [Episyrphus balteatus]|uniref:coiled-coil domain-containing protein 186 n=1 Tax=Episyrphus balteatus TaxID=286459 RepID=UPI0024853037|nr:coiled-coil domain-containing protein 186 [Episyrphus balteatus]
MEEIDNNVSNVPGNSNPEENLSKEANLLEINPNESPHIVKDTPQSEKEFLLADKDVNKGFHSIESENQTNILNTKESESQDKLVDIDLLDNSEIICINDQSSQKEEGTLESNKNSQNDTRIEKEKSSENDDVCLVSNKTTESLLSKQSNETNDSIGLLQLSDTPSTNNLSSSKVDIPKNPLVEPSTTKDLSKDNSAPQTIEEVSKPTEVSSTPIHNVQTHPIPASPKSHPPHLNATPTPPPTPPEDSEKYKRLQNQLQNFEIEIEQLKKALSQKDNTITLYQRENNLLEKEKSAFRKEKELAMKEKESIVITFATKEKSLIDAKKQKEIVEKQLADSRKEVKNISTKFHALNEEKSRITYMFDEKCNEVKKFQKELEKQKSDYNNLEMKLKWNSVKLAQETEAKLIAEKKLEEERTGPKPHEELAKEKLKMEYEATAILLKHEIESKDKAIESLTKEQKQATEKINQLQESLDKKSLENTNITRELECLRQEHVVVQGSYSEEMLNSAKLRGQLEELQVLRTQHTLNEDKINTLNENLRQVEEKLVDSTQDMEQLQAKEQELLSINKEMSEMIVGLQNEICLQTSRVKGIEAENEILKKEKLNFDTKYEEIESQLKQEIQQKNDDRLLLTKHLSEKTKMYELVKVKLENVQGDLEATKKKHSQVVKELQREIQKFKKISEENSTSPTSASSMGVLCRNCQLKSTSQEQLASNHSRGSNNSRSDSESEAQSNSSTMNRDVQGPSKQHLVERILRLQQASARQTEKIDFLENHTLSLVAELQKKSKVVQYYMMRDQAGALTTSKSDQHKTELAKYGGVMSAIYSGIKGPNQSMTLELSLEINKKLQAVLEDTLLKNITLKENLDVLGLEVDKLTRKLAQIKS